jgi:membrane protein DedA with SNARE-associated domain
MPESLQPFAVWLVEHTYLVVFVAALIDSTGAPVPGRLLLVAAGAYSARGDVHPLGVMLAGAAGVALTDQLWYFTGVLGAERVVRALCRWTLSSELSPRRTAEWFNRYGALTIVLGRFFAGVRLLAWPLARPHGVGYPTFLVADALGSLAWSGVWVGLGWLLGDYALEAAVDAGWVGVALAGAGIAIIVTLRLWRRARARRDVVSA